MSSENVGASTPSDGQQREFPPTGGYPQTPWAYPAAGGAAPYPHYPPYGYYSPLTIQTSGWAIASLVCAIVGIATLNFIPGLLGAIFGHVALREIKSSNGWRNGQGMAMAGMIIGYIATGLSLLIVVLYILYLIFIFSFLQSIPETTPTDFAPHLLAAISQLLWP